MSILSKVKTVAKTVNPYVAVGDFVKDVWDPNTNALPGISNPWNNGKAPSAQLFTTQNTKADTPSNGSPETPPTLGGGTVLGATTNDPDAQYARLQIEQGLGTANDALGRLDRNLSGGLQNIANDYASAFGQLTGQRDMARRDNQTAVNNQLQDYTSARDQNNQNARNLLMGTRRLLGGMGAGGGSADRFAAPLAAQTEGNNANAVVKQTNERNLGALTTAREDNERRFGDSFKQLDNKRATSEQQYRSGIDQQRAELLSNIAQLTGQQRIVQGGNYQQAMSAAQPYTQRISSLLDAISANTVRPQAISADQVNLATPELAQYQLGRYDAPAVAQQDASLYNPAALRRLLGYDDQQQQLV